MAGRNDDSWRTWRAWRVFALVLRWVATGSFCVFVFLAAGGSEGVKRLLSTPEAPSWIQAIGALIALFVAVYVPMHDRNQQRKQAQNLAETFAIGLTVAIEGLRDSLNSGDMQVAFAMKHRLRVAADMGALIKLELVGRHKAVPIFGLRSIALEAIELLSEMEAGKKVFSGLPQYFNKLVSTTRQHRDDILAT